MTHSHRFSKKTTYTHTKHDFFREKKSSTPSVLVVVCLAGWGKWVEGVSVRMGGVRELEGG